MKRQVIFVSIMLTTSYLLQSCGAYARALNGDNEKNAIKNLAVTANCPAEDLKILSKRKISISYRYQIEGCGKVYDTDFSGTIHSERKKE